MVRRPCPFPDVTSTIRAIEAAGKKAIRVEYDRHGKVVIVIEDGDASAGETNSNPWDVELDDK